MGKLKFDITGENLNLKKKLEESSNAIRGLENDAEKFSKKMNISFDNSSDGADAYFSNVSENIQHQKSVIKELESEIKKLGKAYRNAAPGIAQENVGIKLAGKKNELKGEQEALEKLTSVQGMYKQSVFTLRKELTNLVAERERLRDEGKQDSEEYRNLVSDIEKVGDAYKSLRTELNLETDPKAGFRGLMEGVQGLMGAYTAISGVTSLFINDNEELMKVQKNLQAMMSILMGLQSAHNALLSTSIFRTKTLTVITEKWNAANAKASAILSKVGISANFAKIAVAGMFAGISAAIAVISILISQWRKHRQELNEVKKAETNANVEISGSVVKLKSLEKVLKDSNQSYDTRLKALNVLKSAMPSYNAMLTTEGKLIYDNTNSLKNYIAQMKNAAMQKFAVDKYVETNKNISEWMDGIGSRGRELIAQYNQWQAVVSKNKGDLIWSGYSDRDAEAEAQKMASRIGYKQPDNLPLAKSLSETLAKKNAELEKWQEMIDDLVSQAVASSAALSPPSPAPEIPDNSYLKTYLSSMEDFRRSLFSEEQKLENDKINFQISLMEDGYDKRKALLEQKYAEEIQLINAWYDKMEETILEREQELWKSEHGGSLDGFEISNAGKTAMAYISTLRKNKKDNAESQNSQNTANLLTDLLAQYQTYSDQRKEIEEKYLADIKTLTEKGAHAQADVAKREMASALFELDMQHQDTLKKVFGDVTKMTKAQIKEAIKLAEDALNNTDLAPEQVKALSEQLASLRNEMEQDWSKGFTTDWETAIRGYKTANDYLKKANEEFAKGTDEGNSRGDEYLDMFERINKESKRGFMGAGINTFVNGMQLAADSMKQIAEASGDERLEKMANTLDATSSVLSATAMGAATGGWIGAIVGAVTSLVNVLVKSRTEAKLMEIEAINNAKDLERAMQLLSVTLDEDKYDSIFGISSIQKAIDAYKLLKESYNEYYGNVRTEIIPGVFRVGHNLNNSVNNLQNMQIQTGKKKSSYLTDLAPGIIDEEGNLDVEIAKRFLETNTQITEEQRKQIQQAIDLQEAYQNALDVIDAQISSVFGSLASDLTDIIWDSVMNGTDAWSEFKKMGSKVISQLGKQLLQEMIISTYLEQFKGRMQDAYGLDSPGAVQAELRNIMGEILGGLGAVLESGTAIAQDYQTWAQQKGFDLTGETIATSGGFQTMSQETGSELNGRFTDIQMKVANINSILQGVETHNEEMRGMIALQVEYLSDIRYNTSLIKNTNYLLSIVARNTEAL